MCITILNAVCLFGCRKHKELLITFVNILNHFRARRRNSYLWFWVCEAVACRERSSDHALLHCHVRRAWGAEEAGLRRSLWRLESWCSGESRLYSLYHFEMYVYSKDRTVIVLFSFSCTSCWQETRPSRTVQPILPMRFSNELAKENSSSTLEIGCQSPRKQRI